MYKDEIITVQSKFDIVEARMRVRTLARGAGFDLFDQARISLATSTLAIVLEMEHGSQGQIVMERLETAGRTGVRVVCTNPHTLLHGFASGVLDDTRRMVDELLVEHTSTEGVKVTLIKWTGSENHEPPPDEDLFQSKEPTSTTNPLETADSEKNHD